MVKNTLMRRAVNDAGVAELEPMLEGPSAVAFVEGDPVAAAKSVVDAAKKFPTLVLKGGFMDGKLLSAADAKALASLESREVMLSKIAGLIKSEMSKAAAMFVGAQSKFLGVLEAYKDKLPAEDVVEAAAAAPEDAPAAECPARMLRPLRKLPPRMPQLLRKRPPPKQGTSPIKRTTTRPKPRLRAAKRRSKSWPR